MSIISPNYSDKLQALIEIILENKTAHAPSTKTNQLLKTVCKEIVKTLFSSTKAELVEFKPFGAIAYPFVSLGKITSTDIFNFDEMVLFAYYWQGRNRYKKVSDIGANIGLHSIILSLCGYEVTSYEPDIKHFDLLKQNLILNNIKDTKLVNAAASNTEGTIEFIRVLGNSTASHIVGSKNSTHGELEKFNVQTIRISDVMKQSDLIKCDIEGHEKIAFASTTVDDWKNCDAIIEVESSDSAKILYEHFNSLGLTLFSQKISWDHVRNIEDMPTSYKDGCLFVTSKSEMSW